MLKATLLKIFSPILNQINDLSDLAVQQSAQNRMQAHPNPLCRYGKKYFSQSDEDGITLEIVKRLGISKGVFAEFGVGNGLENNTLVLIAQGWKGFWVGGESLAFRLPTNKKRFSYLKRWITAENIVEFAKEGLNTIEQSALDIISLDLDGNDIYLVDSLLSANITPKLFIVEYNAKIPPNVLWSIAYDPQHQWMNDDYFGASLGSFVDVFDRHGYMLVCCNSQTGANAFFVKKTFSEKFPEVPANVEDIYVGPSYYQYRNFCHAKSPKTIELLFGKDF